MWKEKEYTGQGYVLMYAKASEGMVITGFRGRTMRVEVPSQIEGTMVVGIDRKAFLSKKNLREIILPPTIREIGDWAFAYCSSLERIILPGNGIVMGRAVFLECDRLECISSSAESGVAGAEAEEIYGWSASVDHLLAAAVTTLDAYYLLDTAAAGSKEWLQKWDKRLLAVMQEDDLEGYQKQILCGEEDYGSTDVNAYLQNKRMKKVKLAMLRLLHSQGLSEENKVYLETYLKDHTKGCLSEETWLVLWKEYPHDLSRMQLFLDLGCAHEGNMDGMLKDMGEEQPEMKARFLRYQDSHLGYQDFFGGLSL